MLLPGFANVHSHAFQYSFAGLAEYKTGKKDSFWTWRKLMYDSVQKFNPDLLKAVAAKLYMEMLKSGYTSVGEFHYLHHQANGQHYSDVTIMSEALIEAAQETGIQLTLLPVLYSFSDFNNTPIQSSQKPFYNTVETFLDILQKLKSSIATKQRINLGIAFHSLRACSIDHINFILKWRKENLPNCPVHIHISEQEKEVDNCLHHTNKSPGEYLFSNCDIDPNWSLIHATHFTKNELNLTSKSGAIIGLCPSTEANLGDGIFNAEFYINQGGGFAIGSDSHISINPFIELKFLEYSQRLALKKRVICSTKPKENSGVFLYDRICSFGVKSLKNSEEKISYNIPLYFEHLSKNQLIDIIVYTDKIPINSVSIFGKKIILDNKHLKESIINLNYSNAIKKILT